MTYEDAIRDLPALTAGQCICIARRRMPERYRDAPEYYELNHGKAILNTARQLDAYMAYYGEWHERKFRWCFPYFPARLFDRPFDLVDWGCGVGIGELALHDFLQGRGGNLRRAMLIEPSAIALARAALHSRKCFPGAEIVCANKRFEALSAGDFSPAMAVPRIHFFSNVLDMRIFDDLSTWRLCPFFRALRARAFGMDEYFLCVSPRINADIDRRFLAFQNACYDRERWVMETVFSREDASGRPTMVARLTHFRNRILERLPESRAFTTMNPEDLIFMAAAGMAGPLQVLLERGAGVDFRDPVFGNTALMYAAKYGAPDAVEVLLRAGADVDARNGKGATALYFAAKYGETDCIRLLLAAGANKELPAWENGCTPFLIAVKRGQAEAADQLVRAGCNVRALDRKGRDANALVRLYGWEIFQDRGDPPFQTGGR